jgi:hypothetical protein
MIASNGHPGPPSRGLKAVLDLSKLPPDSWRPSESAGLRRAQRTSERELERIPAWIGPPDGNEWSAVRIWDYGPDGFGVFYQGATGHSRFEREGEAVELKLKAGVFAGTGDGDIRIPCRIGNSARIDKGLRLGLHRTDGNSPGSLEENLYGHLRDETTPLSARAFNPFLYDEWAGCLLIAVGPDASLVFASEDPSLLLLPGISLDLDIEVPLDQETRFTGKILWIRRDGASTYFSVRASEMSFPLSNAIGAHFVDGELCTPMQLAEFGISLRRFKDQFRFRFIATREEYLSLLSMRRKAYALAGKIDPEAAPDPEEMEFDNRSRLLAAFHGDVPVASVALTFGTAAEPLRAECFWPGKRYPLPMPPRDSIIEARGLCTEGEYRGGDLIQGMFEQIARTMLFSDRKWIATLATDALWPLYRRIGFRKTGAAIAVEALEGIRHHLILLHRDSLLCGRNMSPIDWNYFFGPMVRDLIARGHLEPDRVARWRISWYSGFSGLVGKWIRIRLERKFKALLRVRSKGTDGKTR